MCSNLFIVLAASSSVLLLLGTAALVFAGVEGHLMVFVMGGVLSWMRCRWEVWCLLSLAIASLNSTGALLLMLMGVSGWATVLLALGSWFSLVTTHFVMALQGFRGRSNRQCLVNLLSAARLLSLLADLLLFLGALVLNLLATLLTNLLIRLLTAMTLVALLHLLWMTMRRLPPVRTADRVCRTWMARGSDLTGCISRSTGVPCLVGLRLNRLCTRRNFNMLLMLWFIIGQCERAFLVIM